jgi:hypothetical protein
MTTKSKCCGANEIKIWNLPDERYEHLCEDCRRPFISADTKPEVTDEEWISSEAIIYRPGVAQQDYIDGLRLGLAEGRRRNAEECKPFTQAIVDKLTAWMHDPNRPSVNITFDLITEGFARVIAREFEVQQIDARQREEAAAREAWDAALETCGVATIYERFNKWWKQRRQK